MLRHIQIGDSLKGATIYCTIPDDIDIWESHRYEDFTIRTDNDHGFFGYSWMNSIGSNLEAGFGDISWGVDYPTYVAYDIHSSEGVIWDKSTVPKIEIFEDYGTVVEINTESEYYQYLWIEDGSYPQFGDNHIKALYLGDTQIIKTYLGDREQGKAYGFSLSWHRYQMDPGQTWKEWIDSGKYWQSWDNFAYSEECVYYDGDATIEDSEYNNVKPNDKIIPWTSYSYGRACLGGETMIKTKDGYKALINLEVDDILSQDNIIQKKICHSRNGYFLITFENQDIIRATNDHNFVTLDGVKTTEQLQIGDRLSNNKIKEIIFIQRPILVYEIKTTTNRYELFNGIICECEEI